MNPRQHTTCGFTTPDTDSISGRLIHHFEYLIQNLERRIQHPEYLADRTALPKKDERSTASNLVNQIRGFVGNAASMRAMRKHDERH